MTFLSVYSDCTLKWICGKGMIPWYARILDACSQFSRFFPIRTEGGPVGANRGEAHLNDVRSEIAGSPVKVCSVGTAWLDLALFRQFLPNIGIFI